MILFDLLEDVEDTSYKDRVEAGKEAQEQVKDALARHLGNKMTDVKVARVGSKSFDIEATINGDHQKIEVKSLTSDKPYFAFFDTFVGMGESSPLLDELTQRVTRGLYKKFSEAVMSERDGGFPCEVDKKLPKSGRIPKILKNVTNKYVLDYVRLKLLHDLTTKQINYIAIYNRTTGAISYYHISGNNVLDAPKLPIFRRVYFDTYGAPVNCAIRVVARIAV